VPSGGHMSLPEVVVEGVVVEVVGAVVVEAVVVVVVGVVVVEEEIGEDVVV
jgi:hypothetical protein